MGWGMFRLSGQWSWRERSGLIDLAQGVVGDKTKTDVEVTLILIPPADSI